MTTINISISEKILNDYIYDEISHLVTAIDTVENIPTSQKIQLLQMRILGMNDIISGILKYKSPIIDRLNEIIHNWELKMSDDLYTWKAILDITAPF